jgi:hypothetical protein
MEKALRVRCSAIELEAVVWLDLQLCSRRLQGSPQAAPKQLGELISEVEHGHLATRHRLSLGDLVQRWLDDIWPQSDGSYSRASADLVSAAVLPPGVTRRGLRQCSTPRCYMPTSPLRANQRRRSELAGHVRAVGVGHEEPSATVEANLMR